MWLITRGEVWYDSLRERRDDVKKWVAWLWVVSVGAWSGEIGQQEPAPGRERPHRVVEAIVRLKLPERKERLRALKTIQRFPEKAIPYLIKAARSDDALFRARVANALGLVGKGDRDALWALAALLKDPDTMVRREAIAALVRAGDKSHVSTIRPLVNDRQGAVRADAVGAIAALDPERAAANTKELLGHDDPQVRRAALAELLRLKPDGLADLVARLVGDADPGVRGDAAAALPRLAGKTCVPKLLELLGDPSPYVRSVAVVGLKRLGAREAVPRLLELLDDKDEGVRCEAVAALGALRAGVAIRPLVGQLTASSARVRERSAFALGLFRGEAQLAVPGLIMLLDDKDEGVRQKADLALRLVLGTKVGYEAGAPREQRLEAIARWQQAWRKAPRR